MTQLFTSPEEALIESLVNHAVNASQMNPQHLRQRLEEGDPEAVNELLLALSRFINLTRLLEQQQRHKNQFINN